MYELKEEFINELDLQSIFDKKSIADVVETFQGMTLYSCNTNYINVYFKVEEQYDGIYVKLYGSR